MSETTTPKTAPNQQGNLELVEVLIQSNLRAGSEYLVWHKHGGKSIVVYDSWPDYGLDSVSAGWGVTRCLLHISLRTAHASIN